MKKRNLGLAAFALMGTLYFGLKNELKISRYEVYRSELNNSIKIIFLSDLHSCQYGSEQNELIGKIEKENPDIILLGGDIIDDRKSMKNALFFLDALPKIGRTFYVTGNHEVRIGNLDKVKEIVKNMNIEVLDGGMSELICNNQKIQILGVDDPEVGDKKYYAQIESMKEFVKEGLRIVIGHRPERMDEYLDLEADLAFSGHGHGGQWRIPFLLENGLFAPNQGIFPSYTQGHHRLGSLDFIVGRGLSRETNKIPRFFNSPEIVVVDVLGK